MGRTRTADPQKTRVYLAGKMRGLKNCGFDAFHEAAQDLRGRGYDVISPAEHDLETGFDPAISDPDDFDLPAAMRWDLQQVLASDGVVVLPGWETSHGAGIEVSVALETGRFVLLYPDLTPIESKVVAASQNETRVINATTGGAKGSKLAQLGALDPLSLLEVAEVAGHGCVKYERFNFLKGYEWGLSFDALQRHLLAFWGGEDTDPESGLHHVAHAGWHCLTLLAFMRRHPELDDRPKA